VLHYFRFSALLTIVAVLVAFFSLGASAAVTVTVLIAIEIAFSFDNAIINAKVLERLSKLWQHLFLTIGMVVAILGVRFLLPIVIVMQTAHLSWSEVIREALHRPALYGQHLAAAHIAIAAFGGSFLLTLALYFLLDDNREVFWLEKLERPMQRLGGGLLLAPLVVAVIVGLLSLFAGTHSGEVLRTGLIGTAAYALLNLFVEGLSKLMPERQAHYAGWSAFLAFLYLQVLDASFSFDGVLGAFAITDKVLLIALGLGVGAIWVRSLTVVLVRRGTLKIYIYLEHGAHYAILVLAAALLTSIFYDVPDAVTGISGLGVIGASFVASHQALEARRHTQAPPKKM
jgi:hypothetical protein